MSILMIVGFYISVLVIAYYVLQIIEYFIKRSRRKNNKNTMDWTHEEARIIINNYIKIHKVIPIYDAVVFTKTEGKVISSYTFRHLLCIIYELEPKK